MQRLLSLKLASNLAKKALFSSESTTISSIRSFSRPWRSQAVPQPRPSLAKAYSSLAIKGLSSFGVAFRGFQVPKRSFVNRLSFPSSRSEWKSWLRNLSPQDLTLGLIVANVAVFMLWRLLNTRFMMNNFTISVENFKNGRLHTLITSAFSHMDMGHIIHNMIGLYFFGTHLGQAFGSEFLLKLYLAGGVAGSVFYLVHSALLASSATASMWKDPLRTPGLGASGAVNAIILLDIFLYPRSTLLFSFVIPVPAILLGIYLVSKDFMGMIEGDTPGSAHLGGAAVAAVVWYRLRRGRF